MGFGTVAVRRTQELAEIPLAAIPIAFGIQQLVEGLLWKQLMHDGSDSLMLTETYLLFSHVLWPIYVPSAILLIEPVAVRRNYIAVALVSGSIAGMYFLYAIATQSVSAQVTSGHIAYYLPHKFEELAMAFYIGGTCLAPLLSSFQPVRSFGIVAIIALIAVWLAYSDWLISLWCFFAAILSGLIVLQFSRPRVLDHEGAFQRAA